MNKYVLIGAVTAAIVAGSLGTYALSQSDTNLPSSQDAQEIISDVKDDIVDADTDLGYGQVTKEEGAYSP